MKPKVLITRPLPDPVHQYLTKHCDCTIWKEEEAIPRDQLLKKIAEVDGLLTAKDKVDEELLSHGKNLKIVSDIAVGYDNFDVAALKNHQVLATHTPEVLDETVADLIFGLMLSVAHRIPELDNYVKAGKWTKTEGEQLFGTDVHGKTIGIIGMGRIGEKIARRAAAGFAMDVLYYNRTPKMEIEKRVGAKFCEFERLLETVDYVVVMVPLTKETHRLIGEREFNIMKQEAVFINCSRGQVVDEEALTTALKRKKITGAGLDVFETEPIEKTNELLTMDNVVTVPHIGSATEKTRFDMAMLAAEDLVAGVTGEKPDHLIKELK